MAKQTNKKNKGKQNTKESKINEYMVKLLENAKVDKKLKHEIETKPVNKALTISAWRSTMAKLNNELKKQADELRKNPPKKAKRDIGKKETKNENLKEAVE